MPVAGERPRVQDLRRVYTGKRRSRDVADVVGAGAPRHETEIHQLFQQRLGALRADLAHLQVGAGRHMQVAAAMALAEIGAAGELVGLEDAVGDAHPEHEALLRRGDIEKAVVAPAEIVGGTGQLAGGGLPGEAGIGVEGMLVALPPLGVHELAASLQLGVLGGQMRSVRPRRYGGSSSRRRDHARGGGTCGKTFEIALLLGAEVL